METETDHISVYMGYEVNVQHLQSLLEEAGIASFVKNDFQSALRAGFSAALPGQSQLLVERNQYERAKQITEDTFPHSEEEE